MELPLVVDIAQWCLPSLLQQAGRFASTALAAKSGEISGRSNSSKSEMEKIRRTGNPESMNRHDVEEIGCGQD
jgi:hypothetical protein